MPDFIPASSLSASPPVWLGPLVLVEGLLMVADSETFSPAEEEAARVKWRKHAGRPGLIDAIPWKSEE